MPPSLPGTLQVSGPQSWPEAAVKTVDSICLLASPGQRPGLDQWLASKWSEGGSQGCTPSGWLLPKLPDLAGVWGGGRPGRLGPVTGLPQLLSHPTAPLPTFFLSKPWTPSRSYRLGHPGALRLGRAAENRELKPNICVYNAFSRPTAAGTRGRKKGAGRDLVTCR